MHLLKLILDHYNNILTVLELENYGPLLDCFDFYGRKTLAAYIVNNALHNETFINTPEQVVLYKIYNSVNVYVIVVVVFVI